MSIEALQMWFAARGIWWQPDAWQVSPCAADMDWIASTFGCDVWNLTVGVVSNTTTASVVIGVLVLSAVGAIMADAIRRS